MYKVIVTDHTFEPLDIERAALEPVEASLEAHQCRTAEGLLPLVRDADAVLTQFAPLSAPVIANMKRARVIVRYGVGVDNVDLDAARERGIPVCNVPDYCIDEVADHTLAFILACTRGVVPNCLRLRAGQWGLAVPLVAMRTLHESVVGVVGFGRIGRAVVARLLGFGGRVLVHDPAIAAAAIERAGAMPAATLHALLDQSDVVTLHCPSTLQTRCLLNADTLGRMKRGALLVNLARGDLVDTKALVAALESGQLGGAALDVFDPEPLPPDHPLLRMPNVIVSSHVASCSPRAARQLRQAAIQAVICALRGEPLANVVNAVRNPRQIAIEPAKKE
jgi:D-3-phosphoglycerate dehydrogenase